MKERLQTLSDEVLLDRYNRGEADAFEVLLDRYRRPIFTFVVRSVRDAATAEEIHQDVFLRVIQRSLEFKGQSKFSTWLYTIARNLCIDHSRKMVFRKHKSLDAPARGSDPGAGPLLDRVPAPTPGTDRAIVSAELQHRIGAAVGELPPDQREVFLLRQVHHMPFKEIATVVGVPENTVKSRMRYALERLQEALADYREYAQTLK